MTKVARLVALVTALFIAAAMLWDGARFPTMGLDYALSGAGDRPAELVGKPWAAQEMRRLASEYDVDVVVSGSPQKPGLVAGYPADVGSEFSRWVRTGYPCVRQPCIVKAHSLTDDPRLIDSFEAGVTNLSFMGHNARAAAVAAQVHYGSLGWRTDIQDLNSAGVWLERLGLLFPHVVLVVLILIFLLTAGHTLMRSRSVGVQLLQGNARWQVALSEALMWTVWLWVGAALTLGGAYLVALALVGGHFFHYIARIYAALLVLFWLVGLMGAFLAQQVLRATGILEAVKGRVRFGVSFPVTYALRTVVVVLCGVLLLELGQTTTVIEARQALRSNLGPLSGLSSYGVNAGAADNEAVLAATARETAPLYADGHVVVTRARPQFYYIHDERSVDLTIRAGGDKMVAEVNPTYLELFPTKLADGRVLDPQRDLDGSRIALLLPVGTPDRVQNDLRSYVRSMFSTGDVGRVPGWNAQDTPAQELLTARGNAQYSSDSGVVTRIVDPILIVLPARLVPGKDFAYTSEGIFVRTADIPEVLRRAPSLRQGITGFTPVTQDLDYITALDKETLVRDLFAFVAYLLLLPLMTVAVVLMYTRQHARRIFAQSVNGRGLLETVPLLVVLDLVTLVTTIWYVRPRPPTTDQLHMFGENTTTAPLRNFVVTVAVLLALLVAEYLLFKRMQRSIVLQRGAEA